MRLNIAVDEVAMAQELERACELSKERAHNRLVQATGRWVREVLRWGGGIRRVLEPFDATALLDVVGEVTAGTVLHDQVYIAVRAL